MLKIARAALGAVACLAIAATVEATTVFVTDSTLSPGDSITYSLTFSPDAIVLHQYDATFTVSHSASASPTWYADWFLFKFDTSAVPISALSVPASAPGPWTIVNGGATDQVLRAGGMYSTLQVDGFTGFYVTSLKQGNTPNITQGVLLTGTPPGTATFTFDFTTSSTLQAAMPFKVGYYDGLAGKSGNITFNQLSTSLSQGGGGGGGGGGSVPEPSTVVLLGVGMAALAVAGWKWRPA
jgi:PEP-CTERM motif-containing protein